MQDHPADQLDVEVALADRATRRFANERERLGEQVVERLAVAGAFAQRVGLGTQLGVVEQLHLRLDLVDRVDPALVLLELARLAHPKCAIYQAPGHRESA